MEKTLCKHKQQNVFQCFKRPADPHKYSLTNLKTNKSAGSNLVPMTHIPVNGANMRDCSDRGAGIAVVCIRLLRPRFVAFSPSCLLVLMCWCTPKS